MYNLDRNWGYQHTKNAKLTLAGVSYVWAGFVSFILYGILGVTGLLILLFSSVAMEDTIAVADWFLLGLALVSLLCIFSLFGFIIGIFSMMAGASIFSRRRFSFCVVAGLGNLFMLLPFWLAFFPGISEDYNTTIFIISSVIFIIFILQIIGLIFVIISRNQFITFPKIPYSNVTQPINLN